MGASHQPGGTVEPAALTPDETTFAALAHFLQLVTWIIGPLVIYVLKRESRFVGFHAIQAVLLQTAYTVFTVLAVVVFTVGMFTMLEPGKGPAASTPAMAIFFPLMGLTMMGAWLLMLFLTITVGIKAARGQWAEYPFVGRWAKNIVGA